MRRKFIALALCALTLAGILPPGLAANTPRVVFESGAEDANGVFEVTVTAYNMTFWGMQFALKYDPRVIQPSDGAGNVLGEEGDDIERAFTQAESWMDAYCTVYEMDNGLLGGIFAAPPGTRNEFVNENGSLEVGAEGKVIGTLTFKRLADGDTGLEIATQAKGQPYHGDLPQGAVAVDTMAGSLALDVVFREADRPDEGRSESFNPSQEPEPGKDPEQLLQNVMVLQLGSHAAVVNGNVTAIYRGERDVTAYLRDNRTFVPVRFVGERLGATVGWDNETQTVTVEKDGHKVSMAVGSSTYYLDGEAKTLDAPAEFTPSSSGNPRTMVPIRFVSEALGYQVEWDQERYLVVIAPKSLGWDPKGAAEDQALTSAVTKLAMFSNFV